MKKWCSKHPNVMVLWWAFLAGYISYDVMESLEGDRSLWWLLLSVPALFVALDHLATWYHRTGWSENEIDWDDDEWAP